MPDEPVRIVLVGLGRSGLQWLDVLARCEGSELVGVADRSPERLRAVAEKVSAAVFDDVRQAVGQLRPEAVVAALPAYAAGEFLAFAAARRCHVLTEIPFARTLEQCAGVVTSFCKHEVLLCAATRWRMDPLFLAARARIGELGRVFYAGAKVWRSPERPLDWRGDAARTPGGSLVDLAYEYVDAAVQLFGLPGGVTLSATRLSRPAAKEAYDVEDTAVAILKLEGLLCCIEASWLAKPEQEVWSVHGAEGHFQVDATGLRRYDADGTLIEQVPPGDGCVMEELLQRFLEAVRCGKAPSALDASTHLATAATLEAAYLSLRTGQAESPDRLFRLRGLTPPRRQPDEDEADAP